LATKLDKELLNEESWQGREANISPQNIDGEHGASAGWYSNYPEG
jgi:hypothetical protein